jgi:transposase InsO family protein
MKTPNDVKELQTFLGMVTYMGRFTPRLSELTAPLRDLCKKDSYFNWGPEHQRSFDDVKVALTSTPLLSFYNAKKPLIIQVDASSRGLGAALLQEDGPVEYASKSLSETESRYSNIERETLAVVFGLERFHHYAYGRKVTIESDHKPLETLHKKNVHKASPRIARMLLRIHKYNVEIKYVPGTKIQLADALSRISPMEGEEIKGLDITVHEIESQINASPAKIAEIQQETARDSVLSALKEIIMSGWPHLRMDCPTHLQDYWNYRDELYVDNGLILKGTNVLIPKSMQPRVLSLIHYGHQGVEKSRFRAKGTVFWAGMNKDIEKMIQDCSICQTHMPANNKEPLMPHDIPPKPWHTLGTDLFYFNNTTMLLVADYYSKFVIMKKLSSVTTAAVIIQLKAIFSEHGIPEKLISDNGPQYSSEEFKTFSNQYGFVHATSSPRYAQSNGFIERFVQTVKNILKKARDAKTDPYMSLLCLNTTPISNNIPSPSELLTGRRFKSNLPGKQGEMNHDVITALQDRQNVQKQYYDRSTRDLKPLLSEQPIRMYDNNSKTWQPAVLVQPDHNPRSYTVQTPDGATYRRNRRHLRPVNEHKSDPPNYEQCDNTRDANLSSTTELDAPRTPQATTPSPPLRRSSRISKPVKKFEIEG